MILQEMVVYDEDGWSIIKISESLPVLWVTYFSIHNHGFKHWTLANDKFDHAMNE